MRRYCSKVSCYRPLASDCQVRHLIQNSKNIVSGSAEEKIFYNQCLSLEAVYGEKR